MASSKVGLCAQCGTENPYTCIICTACRSRLPWAGAQSALPISQQPQGQPTARFTTSPVLSPKNRSGMTPLAWQGLSICFIGLVVAGLVGYSNREDEEKQGRPYEITSGAPSSSSSRAGRFTIDQFNRIETGMSHSQVAAIMGDAGVETMATGQGGATTRVYEWSNGPGRGVISCSFQNGEMTTKVQYGLG